MGWKTNIFGFTEKCGFKGGVHEKPIYRGDCLKSGVWTICRFKGGLVKNRGYF